MIADGHEVATYIDVDQLEKGETPDGCGFFTVVLNKYARQPGQPYAATAEQVDQEADKFYASYDGPNVATNTNGMGLEQLYKMIVQEGGHFQNLFPDGGISGSARAGNPCPQYVLKDAIRKWLRLGYPAILAITEDSVIDMGIKGKPYGWNTRGLSHIITATGVSSNHIDLLVRDTVNIGRPGPRQYAVTPLVIISATLFVPSWLPRPLDAFHQLPPAPPAPPVDLSEVKKLATTAVKSLTDLVMAISKL